MTTRSPAWRRERLVNTRRGAAVNAPWPCSTCGEPGVRNLGAQGYCSTHLSELYRTFAPEMFALTGIGLLDGLLRPDFGSTFAELRCIACGAQWIGPAGEPCEWCTQSYARMIADQAAQLLAGPVATESVTSWAMRVGHAVRAGIVTKIEGKAAVRRIARRNDSAA